MDEGVLDEVLGRGASDRGAELIPEGVPSIATSRESPLVLGRPGTVRRAGRAMP